MCIQAAFMALLNSVAEMNAIIDGDSSRDCGVQRT
jgi:hypothetical protein